jgi:hypothetical protein
VEENYYVFNLDSTGFVIISGDDAARPVLGYSFESSFDPGNMPINVRKWMEDYKKQIDYAIINHLEATPEIASEWDLYRSGMGMPTAAVSTTVNPLVNTRWDQSPNYNALCPGGSVTGCVATGMAQIMKYWNYPANGSGFHSYNHETYGTISANFGSATYNWASMPNTLTGPNDAVATLMYHCGVGVDMDYSPEVSGAFVVSAYTNTENCAEFALKNYFGYKASMQGLLSSAYTSSQWTTMLKNELTSGRPILYAGFGSGGGHCFVCDGVDGSGNFHFNWGWSGYYDGYFALNAMNPGGTGTGGGSGGYNSNHQAIIGIEPPVITQQFSLSLYSPVTPSATTLNYGQSFTVSSNFANFGTGDFSGDFCAAIFDNQSNFVQFVEVLTGYSLQAGYAYTSNLVFQNSGMLEMLPGQYYIGMFCKPTGGNWVEISNNGTNTNYVTVNVVQINSIRLNTAITVAPGTTIVQGQPITATLDITNTGAATFLGMYAVNLYDLEGNWVETIGTLEEKNGLPTNYHYLTPFLNFTKAAVEAGPGTYLLAVIHKSNSSASWEITGNGNFQNPIKVIVQQPAYQPDIYETNNTAQQAYSLSLSFSGNTAAKNTGGSNLHERDDIDFFKLNLPSGYNYTITPRLHDKYNSGNGLPYSVDALFTWSEDGVNWSSTYDDLMTGNILIKAKVASTVYLKVAPYFAGETGTYLLDINAIRTSTSGIGDADISGAVNVYPNPATDILFVEQINGQAPISSIRLSDMAGKQVWFEQVSGPSGIHTIPVSKLEKGVYMIQLNSGKEMVTRKVVIQ